MAKKFVSWKPTEILLVEKDDKSVSPQVQVLRVGSFKHPRYGKLEITSATLAEMKKNFDEKVRGIDIAIDYFHDSDKTAAGWVKNLELKENGTELWANVDWTPRAQKMLAEKELRYFSPDFAFQWVDPETQTKYSNVLFGGGLTNRPFVKEMEPLVGLTEDGYQMQDELQACVSSMIGDLIKQGHPQDQAVAIAYSKCGEKKMSELKQKGTYKMDEKDKMIAELQKQVDDLKAQLASMGQEKEAALMEKKKLEEQKALAEKEAAFNVLLSEGKVCAAQKDAYIKNDMTEFVAKAQKVNLSGQGSGSGTGESNGSNEDKVLKLAEEKAKTEKIQLGDAISAVLRENPELRKK